MSGLYGYSREAVRVKVKKCEGILPPEWRKFSVDPQITSLEVLYSILAKAFELKTDFGISYKALDPTNGQEVYLPVLSDYDLDAAFLRAHNLSITTSSEPCLNLRVDIKPFSEAPDWESTSSNVSRETSPLQQSLTSGQRYVQTVQNRLPGLIMNQMEKTFTMVQRALNLVEDPSISQPPRIPLSDSEFRGFLDSVGQIVHAKELRQVIYIGGIEPSLRRVVWKHILNVYPDGMTGRERMDYMKRKASEYFRLRDKWKFAVQKGSVVGELAYVTSMIRKDVLRTDRLHPFYAGNDDNQNIASLFNILTTYALNHPAVSYCQGMSDIASPLLVTMNDEAQAYICFCAVMARLRTNFMLDGIAMTTKFSHLSEALQFYDPEFYDYLKLQQADDLLFCYRWLLLEMKREFAFEDSLRMLEVLWSSLPSLPPQKELMLFEKEFEPTINDISLPKSPSVIRTPRENPYTKICALRRQSSALSLFSSSNTNNSTPSPCLANSTVAKLEATKRMNHSLDENITRDRNQIFSVVKSHQSLDESKMLYNSDGILDPVRGKTNKEVTKNNVIEIANVSINVAIDVPINVEETQQRIVSPIKTDDVKFDKVSKCKSETTNEEIFTGNGGSVILSGSGSIGRKHHRGLNPINNKSIFCSTGNLISKQITNKKSGHFKDLKEKIAASKRGIFASLDKIESFQPLSETSATESTNVNSTTVKPQTYQTKGQKVVKNFNEFLSFASINKSRISDRLTNANSSKLINFEEKSKPKIKLTKSSFDDSVSSSEASNVSIEMSETPSMEYKKPTLQLQLSNIIVENQTSLDGSSPDDSQEYFPMTTSMTRELRLELENLDRQVFGSDFHQRTQFNILSGCDTPESGDSVEKICYSEIIYKKLNQNSIDCLENDSDNGKNYIGTYESNCDSNVGGEEIQSCPIINGVKNRVKSSNFDEVNSFKRISTSSANNDVFIWENPLHQYSAHSPQQTIVVDIEKNTNTTATTPDEQFDLDYDGEIIEENNLGKKSVTPIRLLRNNGDNSNRNSMFNDIDSDNSDSWNENQAPSTSKSHILPTQTQALSLQSDELQPAVITQMTNSCEEAAEAQAVFPIFEMTKASGVLPPPKYFGCGNPFLMFLCLTILLQHRDFVIKSNMDYNEMAMHFDKMVRKHNVTRVLNQARRMYAEYLKSQNNNIAAGNNEINNINNSNVQMISSSSGDNRNISVDVNT